MSCYLNIFLVPKTKEGQTEEPKPLCLMSYCGCSPVYQAFKDAIYPAKAPDYTELTSEKMADVLRDARKVVESSKKYFEDYVAAIKELPHLSDEQVAEFSSEYVSRKDFLKENTDTLCELEVLNFIFSDLKYSDFDKVLINIC